MKFKNLTKIIRPYLNFKMLWDCLRLFLRCYRAQWVLVWCHHLWSQAPQIVSIVSRILWPAKIKLVENLFLNVHIQNKRRSNHSLFDAPIYIRVNKPTLNRDRDATNCYCWRRSAFVDRNLQVYKWSQIQLVTML